MSKTNLFEKIEDVTYTYQKEIEEKDENGNVTKTTQTITEQPKTEEKEEVKQVEQPKKEETKP